MAENNLLSIRLKFTGNEINVRATIEFSRPVKETEFILGNSFAIESIENDNYPIHWEKTGELHPEYRSYSQKIKISCEYPITGFSLAYHGPLAYAGYNIITEEIKALSWYSVWFPQDFPLNITHDEVIIEDARDLFIVKGIFDDEKGTWHYGGSGYDQFNIIAYKKNVLHTLSNDLINIYFIEDDIGKYADITTKTYKDILDFYNGFLFRQMELPVLDIACVSPAIKTGGAYQRKGLFFTPDLGNDDLYRTWILAHETAHNWCQGADGLTWEDWLNETTAEWASLLYALNNNNQKLFHWIIDSKIERAKNYPPIKTIDGSRPQGIHEKGTILFYEIYKKYGKEPIKKMVRGFTDLDKKNTENFIEMIKMEIGYDVADDIIKGI